MAKFNLCVIAVLSLSLLGGCGSGSPKSSLKKGLVEFEKKEYSSAISLLSKAAEKFQDSAELYYTLGLAYLHLGDMDKALAALNKTIDINPAHYEAVICCGQIAFHKNELDSAQKYYQVALKLAKDPHKRAVLFTSMALTESGLKNKGLARLYLIRALSCDRSYAPAYYNLGTLYRDKFGYKEESLKCFKQFIESADESEAHFDKAEKNMQRLQENITRINAGKSVERDAVTASEHLKKGVIFQSEKKYRDAIKAYDVALSADPMAFSAAYGQAMAWQKLNSSRDAFKAFKKALEINPDHQDCYSRAVTIALDLKRYSEATAILDRAIARNPHYISWYDFMTRILHAQTKYIEARKYGEYYVSLLNSNDKDRSAYEKWVNGLPES